ncbi:hypothetical protein KOR42_55650 [Thalassoglobus neptunius]|uniref:Uncharacterized protein n=1 Tax=Thalassoglobus neptunius TaxID=1938619 RepID=A0A5C5US01_9PLAN|nr:hypothetical protein [Thalassoglobus neptunius]TWT29144.1 hypothetical protein KOR42_55650 [Thalassoglobus neptunius]
MNLPNGKSVYSVADFETLGFHNCHVHGIRWDSSAYALILDLDYILQWIEKGGSFEFVVAPAEIRFEYSAEVKVSLDWSNLAMECQIQDIHRRDHKRNPNGTECYLWEIEFATPSGAMELWATDFELKILAEPERSETQKSRRA